MMRANPTDKAAIRIFWQTSLQHKRWLLLSLLQPACAICLFTLAPFFIGKALAALTLPGASAGQYLSYFAAAAIVGVVFNRIGFQSLMMLLAKAARTMQRQALDILLRRGVGFHNNNVGGKLVSDAMDFADSYQTFVNSIFIDLIPLVLIMIVGTTIVFIDSWQLGLIMVVMTGGLVAWAIRDSKGRTERRNMRHKASKTAVAHLADTIVNVQTVKTFAHEAREMREHNRLTGKLESLRIHDWGLVARQGNVRIAVLLLLQGVFVATTVRLMAHDPTVLGAGIFAFSFMVMLSNRLFEIDTTIRVIEESLLKASPMTEILQQDVEVIDQPRAAELQIHEGAISLQDVSFRYQDNQSDQTVFSKLNLNVVPGEKVGLVGPSGGGKSTLTRLLLRFDDIDDGLIAIDSQNIADVTQESLRSQIAYVPQEPLLFHRTIRENISYGKDDASDKELYDAARAAHADSFIQDLPDKYDTIVGERGVKLSGGQRQRVAIARAIMKDAPILILDEATSALDSESEVLIQDALWKLMQGRTAIVIAHRLSTIQKMDRIIVMDDGQIVEQGTHKELLKQKGTYAKLWAHQSGGFIVEDEDE